MYPAKPQGFDEKNFILYNSRDGLSDSYITGLTQDDYGYIWISTPKGLNRFDGNNFLQFYSDDKSSSLPADYVSRLKWLDREQLGAATTSGLHIINSRTLEQRNIIVPPGPLNRPYMENNLQGIIGDDAGNIFLLSATGFYHFNNKYELVFRYDHYKKEDVGKTDVPFGRSDGLIMPRPDIILLATTAGQYKYQISTKDLHVVNENDETFYRQLTLPEGRMHFMHSNKTSFSVITEGAGELTWFDLQQKKKYPLLTDLTDLNKLFGWRSKITRVDDSTFIITGLQKGFYLLNFNSKTREYRILPELYLPGYLCTSVLIDNHSRLWIGTNRGLLRQKRNTGNLEKIALPIAMNPLGRAVDTRMVTVTDNKLFVATHGAGIYVFDRNNLQYLKRIDFSTVRNSGSANMVYSLLALSNDSIYAGTYGPLLGINTRDYSYRVDSLPNWDYEHKWISWQHLSRAKVWYVTSSDANSFYYRRTNEKKMTRVVDTNPLFNILTPKYITEDPRGNIWFAGHGASRFNTLTGQFDLLIDSFPRIKTERKQVNGIAFGENGKIYFAIVENGLAIYDPAKKTFEHITRSDGLPDNTIRAIYLHNNKLWLGTESGLACYDINSKKIFSFGLADDMPEGTFTGYDFYYDSAHNHLYGGFNNTIIRFNPDSLIKNDSPPGFFVESILVAGKNTLHHPPGQIKLSYQHNDIIVNLAAVNFEDAYQQLFAYRLAKNGDEPWQEAGSQQSIIFSNLSPGKHRLQVKVYIKNNSWPEQIKEIEIIVYPPFWRKAWFILLASLLFISLFYFLYRYRIKTIRQKASIDRQLAELEMTGLHAQMNPHFIFNSLNSIKEMILEDEKQNASRYLSKFAQLIRTNLEQSKQTFISVKQCIEHLQQYLEMEKIRFDGFSYAIEISNDLRTEEIQMPPMLVQPLVENAIWHGLHPQQGEKNLYIRFFSSGLNLICEIEDNGIGIVKSRQNKSELRPSHNSLGITNVKERLQVLNEKYKMNCSLIIIDKGSMPSNNGSGTMVRLELTILNYSA